MKPEVVVDASELDRLYLRHVASLGEAYANALVPDGTGPGAAGWDALVVHSGTPARRSVYDDQFWPLRPCPHFRHWLPLSEPDALLVLRPGQRPRLIRAAEPSIWEAPAPSETEAFNEALDVVTASTAAQARQLVGAGRVAFVGEDPTRAEAYGASPDGHCPPALIAKLDALRTTKTAY
ncbi:MAG: hypothetical protein ACRENE_28220 [Polyangiaceae bacterium]